MSPPDGRRSELVHARLRADILEGRLAPEAAVASERTLAEQIGVNRHAVRGRAQAPGAGRARADQPGRRDRGP